MHCSHCGTLNDDDMTYCMRCGKPLESSALGQSSANRPEGSRESIQVKYLAQMVRGDHKHMSLDVSLQDERGTQVMSARRPSPIRIGFELIDAKGQTVGHIDHETHLTRKTFKMIDSSGSATAVLQMQSIHSRGMMPKCWWEDKDGNRLGDIEFHGGFLSFSLVRVGGSKVFSVTISVQGGVFEKLQEFATRRYDVTLFEASFPLQTLMGFIASMDSGIT